MKSDSVVVNDLLADYYRIPAAEGSAFRRVAVPSGQPRGGLLGMAAILAMGSDGEREFSDEELVATILAVAKPKGYT